MSPTLNPTQTAQLSTVMENGKMRFESRFSFDGDLEKLILMDRNGAEPLADNGALVWKVGTGGGYAVAGTDLPKAQHPTFATVAWEPQTDYQNVEIGFNDALKATKQSQLWPGLVDAVKYKVDLAGNVLHSFTNDMLVGDGSGRLAKIVTISQDKKTLTLDPVFCKAAAGSRARSAVQYLHLSQAVTIVSYDESDPSSAAVVDGGDGTSTDGDGFTITVITPSDTNHGSSVTFATAVSANVAPGMWVCVNKGLNAMPKGLFAMLGNGSIVGTLPRYGLANYGTSALAGVTMDRSLAANEWFTGAVYNNCRFVSDPTAEITLNRQTMLNMMQYGGEFTASHDPSNKPVVYGAFMVSPDIWNKYVMTAVGTPTMSLFGKDPVPHPDLGITAPTFTNPWTGQVMPLLVCRTLPPDVAMFLVKNTILTSMIHSDWDKTGADYFGYFMRLLKLGLGDTLRAAYSRLWYIANKYPDAMLTVHNVNITQS